MGYQGIKGQRGPQGYRGPDGPNGTLGLGDGGYLFAVHSQKDTPPSCPEFTHELYTGYSLVTLQGDDDSITMDLGSPSSCPRVFSIMPFASCFSSPPSGACQFNMRNGRSFWLSTLEHYMTEPLPVERIQRYISRCVVCESRTNLVAFHSQRPYLEESCPPGWEHAWNGFSMPMVRLVDRSSDDQRLVDQFEHSIFSFVYYRSSVQRCQVECSHSTRQAAAS